MYENLFSQIGKTEEEIDRKIAEAFHLIFEDEEERFYFENENGTAYMMDTGNIDARTEGMSYGMMMAVQMNRQDIFDKLWAFSMKYMHHSDGIYEGYFAWSCQVTGVSGKYLSIANYIYDPEIKFARNLSCLMASDDLKEWKVVCNLHDFRDVDWRFAGIQYVAFEFQGDDLIYLARTALNNPRNHHDSNYSTFHRIKNFRELL